jgi:hypothetical protein
MVHHLFVVFAAFLMIPGLPQAGPDPRVIDFGGQEIWPRS